MLNPESDRLDYGELLTPPEDYELDFAIGTTYSLDLDTLVGACLSLGLSEDLEVCDKIHLLEALKITADKMVVFCESGQIKLPNKVTPLYCLLEKIVFGVALEKKRKENASYPAFHPKIWLIRFIKEKQVLYRFIILSRNLTFDRSWDISFVFEGFVGKETIQNSPLQNFFKYLTEYLPNNSIGTYKKNKISKIIQELNNVNFSLLSDNEDKSLFYRFQFLPNVIRNNQIISESELFTSNFDKLIIVSPFLTAETVGNFNNRQNKNEEQKCWLFTRKEEFLKIPKSKKKYFSNFNIFVLNETVVEGEHALFTENIVQQNIHAKIFIMQKGTEIDLYLGSLNCSHKAKECNVEFLIQLKSKNLEIFDSVLNDFTYCEEDKQPLFTEIKTEELLNSPESEANDNDFLIKDFVRLNLKGKVEKNSENLYDINFEIDKNSENYPYVSKFFDQLFIRNLSYEKNQEKNVPINDTFKIQNIGIDEISELFILCYQDISRIIKIPLEGIPNERDDYVISSIIENTEGFFKYMSLILEDDSYVSAFETSLFGNELNSSGGNPASTIILPGMYEKLLKVMISEKGKQKMMKLDTLIHSLEITKKENIIPEGFVDFYRVFKEAVQS